MPDLMHENVGWVKYLHGLDQQQQLSFFAISPGVGRDESVSLALTGLNLVDTSQVSWRQVHEFRSDQENVRKLRNLRLLLAKDYAGKEPAFIRDDLERQLEEYEEAAKVWGFPLTSSIVDVVLNERALGVAAATAIAPLLSGLAPALSLVAMVGAGFMTGRVGWEVVKRYHQVGKLNDSHALAYLVRVKALGSIPPKAVPGATDSRKALGIPKES
jgi:hypothetical protein